ncbi:leucine-rich repeat protein, partial [uncultured Muribaculum sp.]|uniref:leucine-rich repeat protein n=1 Tax=uncultured Muribaculum sp. TaxID=1918613 RepID=UPI0026355C2E
MKKNRSIRTTFYTASQLIIVLLLIYASSHNAFSQPIENSISSYSYNNGDTFAPDINSPIRYRVVDNEKKEVEVIRGFSPSGQDGPRIMGAFSIPKEVEYGATWTIVGIGDATFIDENQMEAITLPETIKRIGKMAFKNCTRLYRIQIEGRADANKDFVFNLPPSLEEIGEQAFYECIAFGNIKIPDSVRLIGEQAFYRCINLSEIKIPDSVQLIGKQAFYNCTNLQYLTIGKSVEHILEKTFYFCPLSKITLNEGLKTIGSSAFCQRISPNNQGALTELIIPDSVTKIEADAFGCCSFLKNLVLGSSLNSIGDHAFFNSISLKTVTLRTPEPPTLGIYVFSVSKESTNFYVPECTRHKYLRQYPWKEYTIIDPFVLTDFVVEVEGEVVDDIFTKGLTMQEGEQKSIKATPVPYVKDLYLSWSNRYYGISGCWAMNLPCENTTTITAKESGTDYVEISCGAYNFSKTFVLTVLPPPEVKPEKIELSHETLSLEKGESVTIMATVMPEDATDKTITWASSDEAVATVNAEGKVT